MFFFFETLDHLKISNMESKDTKNGEVKPDQPDKDKAKDKLPTGKKTKKAATADEELVCFIFFCVVGGLRLE